MCFLALSENNRTPANNSEHNYHPDVGFYGTSFIKRMEASGRN